jgi:lipopolysaccharide transport system permease protein
MNEIKKTLQGLYKSRFFLEHLVKWDIKFKFRRSVLGFLWTIIQPLLLTLIIATVFSIAFHQPMKSYAPYILSGILVWDVIQGSIVNNSGSIIAAETYIRQVYNPVIIYPLRYSIVTMVSFLIASSSFVIWILILCPQNLLAGFISLPFFLICAFLLLWSFSTISSHINLRFRDYPYVMALVMQIFWYFSPVFFKRNQFDNNIYLKTLFEINPVSQILDLFRTPFFNGVFASAGTYVYVALFSVICAVIAYTVNRKYEDTVIYYF